MRYDEIRAILKRHFAELLAKKKASIAEEGRLDHLAIAALEGGAAYALQALSDGRSINPVGDDTPTLDALIAKYNLPVERGSPGYANLHVEFKRAYLAYCRSALAYDRSLDGYDFMGGGGEHSGKQSALPAMTLETAVKSFMDDRRMGAAWARKTQGERSAHVKLLYEIFGEGFDIQSFGPEQARQTKDTLGRYPKNRRKCLKAIYDYPHRKKFCYLGPKFEPFRAIF
jgi:hypothetical protein